MNEGSIFTKILVFRKTARLLFQKYQTVLELVFKFVIFFFAYKEIISSLDYAPILTKTVFKVGFGLVGMILPSIVSILLCCAVALYEVYAASPFLAIITAVVLLILYCFVARFSGKNAWAVVAVPLLFKFNLQYLVPLLLGMIATPMAIFPAASGVCAYYIFRIVNQSVAIESTNVDEVLALYLKVIDDIINNREMLFTAAIFALVITVMWLIRKLSFDFVFEVTILIGATFTMIGLFIANLKFDAGISSGSIIGGTLLSLLIVSVVQFFYRVLDYNSVERVQFEDDDYYYYVKAVPKIDVAIPEKSIKFFALGKNQRTDEFEEVTDEELDAEKSAGAEPVEKAADIFEVTDEPQDESDNTEGNN